MTSNAERSAATQSRLIEVARRLFAQHGYSGTSTESILEQAGVRRGAMYHHFKDKAALFEAVCLSLSREALAAIDAATARAGDPLDALERGLIAWITFVTRDEARRILLVDAPTVLGGERSAALDRQLGFAALQEGIHAAIDAGSLHFNGDVDLLATMLNGALEAVALRLGRSGAPPSARAWQRAVRALFRSLARPH